MFNINIDGEGLFRLCGEWNVSKRSLTFFRQNVYKWNGETKTLRCVFEQAVKIFVNDLPYSENHVVETPRIKIAIKLGNEVLVDAVYDIAQKILSSIFRPICTYDILRFNQSGLDHLQEFEQRGRETSPALLADLHTHFTAALDAKTLVDIVKNAKIPVWYPVKQLIKNEICFSGSIVHDKIDLSASTTQIEWNKFQHLLSIHPLRVSLFPEMEEVYNNRNPLLKNHGLFESILIELAKDYERNGIEYVELSLSDIVVQEWTDVANRVIPLLEQEYGVSLRFLVGIWRHSPKEYNEDLVGKIKAHIHNPYIKGADIMGQETNSNNDFISLLDTLNTFKDERPDFVIRVHSGESPCHPDNVKIALKHGATRIGHGIHGFSDEVAELAKKVGAIFELCISSNNALHSITNPGEIPLKKLVDLGIKVSIGTDGHGFYRTTHAIEAHLARRLGLTANDLNSIVNTHRQYIKRVRDCERILLENHSKAFQQAVIPVPKFPKDGWALVESEKLKKRKEVEDAIHSNLSLEIVSPIELSHTFKGLTPILFAGASSVNWEPVLEADKTIIQQTIQSLFEHLDSEKVLIVTGGTDFGLEKLVHDEVKRQKVQGRKFTLLGGLASNLEASVSTISKALTHAVLFDYSWYDTAPNLIEWIKAMSGMAIYIGGGDVVKSMIYSSKNIGIDFLVMDEVFGASSSAAKLYPAHSFKMGKGALEYELIKHTKSHLLHSAVLNGEQALDILDKKEKRVITFLGYSSEYADEPLLIKTIIDQLKNLSPKNTLINAGGTAIGIGLVYKIAKEHGFETIGIVSTNAKREELSQYVDFVIYIQDNTWGGEGSAVSEAIVKCSDFAIALGGGKIAHYEMIALKKLGKDVMFFPFENIKENQ